MSLWDGSWPAVEFPVAMPNVSLWANQLQSTYLESTRLGGISARLFVPHGVPIDVYSTKARC